MMEITPRRSRTARWICSSRSIPWRCRS